MRNKKGQFEKGNTPPNKKDWISKICEICGSKFSVKNYRKDTAKTCSRLCQTKLVYKKRKYRKHSDETKKKIAVRTRETTPRGDKCHSWKGGITPKNEKARKSVEIILWRKSVYVRDNYSCQDCGVRGGKLHAHHIKPFAQYPELRTAISNGITLCGECHRKRHTKKHE